MTTFQPMPELAAEDYSALRDHIAEHGILHPVVIDQHGRIIDGHHRTRIARELGIDRPTVVREVADDDEAMDIAVSVNCLGRQLSQEQKRHVIGSELARRPLDSDRAVARRIGCSPTTVGTVRADRRREAEEQMEAIRQEMKAAADHFYKGVMNLVRLGADVPDLIRRAEERRDEAQDVLQTADWDNGLLEVPARALLDNYIFTCLPNDLGGILEEVRAYLGPNWRRNPLSIGQEDLDDLIDDAFARVQSGHAEPPAELVDVDDSAGVVT